MGTCLLKVINLDFQSVALSSIPPGNAAQPDKHMLTSDLSGLRREVDDVTVRFMHTETGTQSAVEETQASVKNVSPAVKK